MRTRTAPPDTALSVEDLETQLNTTPEGLARADAARRLEEYGYNEIAEERVHPFIRFLSYFWGPIPWMIITAAVLSGVLHHWEDVAVITALLVMNAVVGFREEYQAGNVIEALKKTLALSALAKRDGAWEALPARELVPGDMIRLRIGDIVPADARLLGDDPVEVDQSALTGESLPVEKKRATRSIRVRSCARAKLRRWSMRRAPAPITAGRPNWSGPAGPAAICSVRSSPSPTI